MDNTPIFLAPHAILPPRDGPSIRSHEIARAFADSVEPCYFVSKESIQLFEPNGKAKTIAYLPSHDQKLISALRALSRGTHYLEEKHLSAPWRETVSSWLAKKQPSLIYSNFLWSWPVAARFHDSCPVYIDTHNYDLEWFDNLRRSARNPLTRKVCATSGKKIEKTLQQLPAAVELIHVSPGDSAAYQKLRPNLIHHVLPNGCSIRPRSRQPDYTATIKRLYFLGALSVQISLDSLLHFDQCFWPVLKDISEFHVLGSRPSGAVTKLCAARGWALRGDLSELELSARIATMHFACLPFAYGAGSKLKFVDACGRGVPVLTTPAGVRGFENLPSTILVSRDPSAWRAAIEGSASFGASERGETLDFANRYSWSSLASAFFRKSIVPCPTL